MKRRYDSLVKQIVHGFGNDATCAIVKPPRSVTLHAAYMGFKRAITRFKLHDALQVKMFDGELRIVRTAKVLKIR